MKALFIGGTGVISMAITRLVADNPEWEVFLLNRGNRNGGLPENVTLLNADINDAATVRRLVEPHTFDVVAQFIGYEPADARRDVGYFLGKTRQYMFVSTCATYQKPVMSLPITEDTPQRNPFWAYAQSKIACEEVLLGHYREDGFPVTIVRPSHTYDWHRLPIGVGGSARGWQIVQRLRQNKPVVVHGDGTSLWTLTHADDFAVGFAGLMGNPLAVGHAVNLVSDDVMTWDVIYRIIADTVGAKLRAVHVPSEYIARVRPDFAGGLLGDKAHSLVFDTAKLRRLAPEFRTTIRLPHSARKIIAAMDATPSLQKNDWEFDQWCDEMASRFQV